MTTDSIRSEEAIIQGFFEPLARGFPGAFGLKDDCAVLAAEPGHELVLKTDAIAEGVHFFADDPPADIGWKALAVNVSDLAAKGARPVAYLMALAFPQPPHRAWLAGFAEGLRLAQQQFGCHLVGGDTDRRPGPVAINITAIGTVPIGQMVRRGMAKPGDQLFVTGTLGDAALGLALRKDPTLAGRWRLTTDEVAFALQRYLRPEPRLALTPALRAHAAAAMDLSDGLIKDLGRMCAASGVGARIRASDLPVSAAVSRAVSADDKWLENVLAGGDDYELLIAVAPIKVESFLIAASGLEFPVTQIGEVSQTERLIVEGPSGAPIDLPRTGYDHF